ncbi:hypothetical protein HPB51_025034 [Rhipicephalus microplus]|uniref:Tick transposon n=1 Tax=Rhipicephalus microplus TaxID=6941 RepID=A0A9J6DDY9_RHIMP|nr:hypothetical protein HPB51_025034 [Rhipicephalus microplus]
MTHPAYTLKTLQGEEIKLGGGEKFITSGEMATDTNVNNGPSLRSATVFQKFLEHGSPGRPIVFGTRDTKVRDKLLADNKLTLENAEKTCKAAEISAVHQEAWGLDTKQDDPVCKQSHVARTDRRKDYKCLKCGRTHELRNCPVFGKACRKCKKKNHFTGCCRASANIDELEDDFDVLEISVNKINRKQDWTVKARVNNASGQLKVN